MLLPVCGLLSVGVAVVFGTLLGLLPLVSDFEESGPGAAVALVSGGSWVGGGGGRCLRCIGICTAAITHFP